MVLPISSFFNRNQNCEHNPDTLSEVSDQHSECNDQYSLNQKKYFWQNWIHQNRCRKRVYRPKQIRAELISEYQPTNDEFGIAYQMYRLPNGLTVVLHEDHSNPETYIQLYHQVGEGNANPGYSGFAHLYEHLMFDGTRHTQRGEYDNLVQNYGGWNNAKTGFDYTHYYQYGASNALELQLWLEAERLAYITEGITEESFDVQRQAVKEEKAQNYSSANSLMHSYFLSTYFPQGHPYHISPIGLDADLERATLNDVHNFFLNYYSPQNTVLTIAGDFNSEQTLEWVEKYFGALPPGPKIENKIVQPIILTEVQREVVKHPDVTVPKLRIVFPTENLSDQEKLIFEFWAWYFDKGAGHPLYDHFKTQGLASRASARFYDWEQTQFFRFDFKPLGKNSLETLEKEFLQLLIWIQENPPTQSDIERFVNGNSYKMMDDFQTYDARADFLAEQAYQGDLNPGNFSQSIFLMEELNVQNVMAVYNQYFADQPYYVLSLISGDKSTALPSESENVIVEPYKAVCRQGLSKKDPFALRPELAEPKNVAWPQPWQIQLNDGTPVYGITNTHSSFVQVNLRFHYGKDYGALEDRPKFYYLEQLFLQETTTRTRSEILEIADLLGMTLEVNIKNDYVDFSMRVPKDNLDEALAILEDVLINAQFPQSELDLMQAQDQQYYDAIRDDPEKVLNWVFYNHLYGNKNSSGSTPQQTKKHYLAVTLSDVEEEYQKLLKSPVEIYIAGNINPKDELFTTEFNFVENLPEVSETNSQLTYKYCTQPEEVRIIFYAFEGASQSFIQMGYRHNIISEQSDPTWYFVKKANYALGSDITSRLYQILREEKGFTYGAYSMIDVSDDKPNNFSAYYSTSPHQTVESLQLAMEILTDYHENGPTEDEWQAVVSGAENALASAETVYGQVSHLLTLQHNDLATNYKQQNVEALSELDHNDRLDLIQRSYDPLQMQIVIVADPSVYEDLKILGYPIDTVDLEGNVLESWSPENSEH